VLLVANAVVTSRMDAALRRDADTGASQATPGPHARRWRRRRAGALASVVLWFGLVLVGTALASH
jgi:hypothetical protein